MSAEPLIAQPAAARRAEPAEPSSSVATYDWPMPEGFGDRLTNGALTDEDLAFQAHLSLTQPSSRETTLLTEATRLERQLAANKRLVARERAKRGAQDVPTSAFTGNKTLADLRHGPPPPQLADPFLTPEGVTVLYGPGGVGKGMLSVHLALHLVRGGIRVLIIDFEGHANEWGTRARAMGFTDDELLGVQYKEPYGPSWEAPTGPLIDIADLIREDCDRHDIEYLIIDSYSAATSNGDSMGGKDAADEFFRAIRLINRPAAVIAHVSGSAGRFPDRPFGSVFVHNFARETWAVENTQDTTDIPFDPSTDPLQPTVLSLELRNKKMNGRPRAAPEFLTFSFFLDGHIEADTSRPYAAMTLADMLADILRRADRALTTKDFTRLLKDDFETRGTQATIRSALLRHPDQFSPSSTAPRTWSLA